jgi:hypothetical protein
MTVRSDTSEPPAESEWVTVDSSYANIPGMDPYVEWALGAGRAHFFLEGRQQRWLPVLLQLRGVSPGEFADGHGFIEDGQSLALWRASIRVDSLYAEREQEEDGDTYCTAMVRPGFFEFMRRSARLRESVARVTIGLPLDAESLPPAESNSDSENGQP